MIRRGLISASFAYPSPRLSSTPGLKFSTSTSAWRTIAQRDFSARGLAQIEADAALAAVLLDEAGALSAKKWREAAHRVAAGRHLDLDYLGAGVGHHSGHQRAPR